VGLFTGPGGRRARRPRIATPAPSRRSPPRRRWRSPFAAAEDRNWTNLGKGQPETLLLAAVVRGGRGSQLRHADRPPDRGQRPSSAAAEDRNTWMRWPIFTFGAHAGGRRSRPRIATPFGGIGTTMPTRLAVAWRRPRIAT